MAERLLLDTHVVLWWLFDHPRLSAEVDRALRSAREVWVSAASAWEVAIKQGLGRLDLPGPLEPAVARSGFGSLPVTFDHAREVAHLPPIHRDPFGRLLVATALVEGLTLVSADELVLRYPVDRLDAR